AAAAGELDAETQRRRQRLPTPGSSSLTQLDQRQCCGNQRAFEMTVEDNSGQECMCYGQCFSCSKCCFDTVTVEAPPGRVARQGEADLRLLRGQVQKSKTSDGDTVLYTLTDRALLQLVTKDREHEIGRVSKQWSNLLQEYFTDADKLRYHIPKGSAPGCQGHHHRSLLPD
uniref:Phospholipid scramblase n=1 Tax=Macrostomum lignano TaxID=282301 RepID=A0A1I8FHH6_9PLAT